MFIFFGVEFSFSGWSHFKGMSLEITFLKGHFFKLVIRVFRQKKTEMQVRKAFSEKLFGVINLLVFMRCKRTPEKGGSVALCRLVSQK